MRSFPASACRVGRLAGAAGMLFLFTLAIPVQAAEQDELATAMRQLDQVQAALERARGPLCSPARLSHPVTSLIIPGRVPIWRPFVMASIAISRLPGPSPVQRQP